MKAMLGQSKCLNHIVIILIGFCTIVSDKIVMKKDGEFEVITVNPDENSRTVMTQTPPNMEGKKG